MSDPVRIVPCPNCRKPTQWSTSNQYRPFCSERCRLIDFGGWVNETNTIPGDESFDDVSPDDLEPR
ncbi:MAG: DNA gyrase inhibitor YacG [Gammaproteobacteria bacterium]|nr:DNA gyrase inhibitor YacG [Gammaproteobacteria bacterium]